MMKQGMMIAIEGNDGAGKSTAARAILEYYTQKDIPVLLTREPGGGLVSEQIREVLLHPQNAMDSRTEALLYAAARREHLKTVIEPALKEGKIVICDRFLDSSLAYQGVARGLGIDTIEQLNDFALEGFRPDRTLFLAVDPQTAKERIEARGDLNRLDAESQEFHKKVREGFERCLARNPAQYVWIDASQSPQAVAGQAIEAIEALRQARMNHGG